ncbi:MAG: polysaccharide deacetylase family protein [Actinomycetes bacterium]
MTPGTARTRVKQGLARIPDPGPAAGMTMLIYHRVGGGSRDERDLAVPAFHEHLRILAHHEVLGINEAWSRVQAGDLSPSVVLTFDDGFADVYAHAWPELHEHRVPFTLYLATAYLGGTMHWDGSTATSAGPGLSWPQVEEMVGSGLATVGAHTHHHVRPEALTVAELEACDAAIEAHVGRRPAHFAYPWGIPVPAMSSELRQRYRTAATGRLGRNTPGVDPILLRRVPVRRSDPRGFFAAKLTGSLHAERAYTRMVDAAKRVGLHA